MRIGLVSPYSFAVPGGVQSHVLGLAAWLAARDHEVDVLGPDGLPAAPPAGVRFTSCGHAFPVRYNGSVARISFGPTTIRVVQRWLAQGSFDIVHLHEPLTPSAALIALGECDAPLVASFHTANPSTSLREVCGRLLSPLLDKIAVPIAVSETAAVQARAALGRDVTIIPNGVDAGRLGATISATGPWRGGPRPRITFLGRDEPRKGLDTFVAAGAAIRAAHPDADVVVAGNTRRPLPAGIRVLATPDDDQRNELLAATDVYVAPNTGRESFGIVLVEALAAGAGVVASDLAAFRATVGTDVVRYFAPEDSAALAAAVVAELAAPAPEADRRAVAARYDWSRVGGAVEAAYRRAAGGVAPIA